VLQRGLGFARGDFVDLIGVPFEHLIDKVVGLFARPKRTFGLRILRDLQIAGLCAPVTGIEVVDEGAFRPVGMSSQCVTAEGFFLRQDGGVKPRVIGRCNFLR
jgi:hypothetical protein